ncbi:DNA recombination protein RmuC [Candidatus Odyssella thessalonicensis]|uniref:DNA recombination protein RmuC n=1 Tax=Candidatus Odyssella thessalonicensis TaxID=84647 RepID=UPI000225ABCF|nr:DNA recombination protein RmuC [Candidatus Odyssella thessalonicensis]
MIDLLNQKTLFIAGLAAGTSGLFIWLTVRWQYKSALERYESELQRLDMLLSDSRGDLQDREQRIYEMQTAYVAEKAARAVAEEKATRTENLEAQLQDLSHQFSTLKSRNVELQSALEYERRQAAEKLQMLENAQIRLGESFKSLSAEALATNNKSFLHLAQTALEKFQETARMDLGQRQQAIVEMMQPVHQALLKVDSKIIDLEKQRVGAYEVLREQVKELIGTQKELRLETSNLVKALRAPSVRGQWGEMQLRRVVEMAGMVAHCDFLEQVSTTTDNGRARPDMIINLPGGKKIIVDAKAPLSAYLEAFECQDDRERQQKMMDHARQVRTHIRTLSQRAYWDQFDETPEFVVLFLPGETFFSAALECDPALIETGVKEKVILATPTTLIALLRAVAYGWRQEALTESTRVIGELGKELYKRISDMGEHFSRLGRHLAQSVDCYNQTLGTLERRVLVTARKFKDIDSASGTMEELDHVDAQPRSLQSPELSGAELEDLAEKLIA